MSKLVIGVDQSYTATGIGLAVDSKLLKIRSLSFVGANTKASKRKALRSAIRAIIEGNKDKFDEIEIIVERIRTNSSKGTNQSGKQDFGIRPNYIKSTGALIASIVDEAEEYNIPVYSADTRSWKSQVIPKEFKIKYDEKCFLKPEKMAAVAYIKSLGFDVYHRDKSGKRILVKGEGVNAGKIKFDDDKCDAGCIALYGFCKDRKLILEE